MSGATRTKLSTGIELRIKAQMHMEIPFGKLTKNEIHIINRANV
jgi:hypothetical protein